MNYQNKIKKTKGGGYVIIIDGDEDDVFFVFKGKKETKKEEKGFLNYKKKGRLWVDSVSGYCIYCGIWNLKGEFFRIVSGYLIVVYLWYSGFLSFCFLLSLCLIV